VEIQEILRRFEKFEGRFEQEAVEAAVAHRDEITPELLRVLEYTVDHVEDVDIEGYMAHLYAMFLLAQFRETRAYPLVVRFALLPEDRLDSLGGDFTTEHLGHVLASVCGGELGGIQSVIENPDACQWARGAALGGLVTLVSAGLKTRDEIVHYLGSLFRGRLKRRWSNVWDVLVSSAADLYPAELMEDVEHAFEEELVDPGFIALDDVKRDLALGKDSVLARLTHNPHRRLAEDTVEEMGSWSCFHDEAPKSPATPKYTPVTQVEPIRRDGPKVGRNDPCPCGSGKKYKKCCGS
jgi:hypothetical protein